MRLLNYTEYGQGRPIIILHGLFGSSRNWQGIARVLASSHHIITPDLRNHGLSPHTESMSYKEMAEDVISLADHLKLEDIILIGHSMGGKVAMTAALTQSERFSALVIVDIAPVTYDHDYDSLIKAMNSLTLETLHNRSDAEKHLAKTIKQEGLIQFLLQNLIRTEKGFQWRINLKQITANITAITQFPESLQGLSCRLPSLFLGGADSNYLRSIHNPAIYQHFPSAEISMIEGAGHWLHAEKPNDFLKHLKSFINFV